MGIIVDFKKTNLGRERDLLVHLDVRDGADDGRPVQLGDDAGDEGLVELNVQGLSVLALEI